MDYDKNNIVETLREQLKKLPFYKESDLVLVYPLKKGIYITYTSENNTKNYFDIEIMDDSCEIHRTYLEKNGIDNGNLLIDIIEEFSSNRLNCKRFVVTPSVELKRDGFWDIRGYHYMNGLVLEKIIDK